MPSLLRAIRSVRKAESLRPEQIRELQDRRLRKLLKHAFEKSRFYQRHYRAHGITRRDLDSIQPEQIPVIDKNVMMANYDDLITDPALTRAHLERFIDDSPTPGSKYKNRYSVVHTSGSSGTIGLFVYAPHEWQIGKALSLRVTGVKLPLLRRKRIAFIAATDGHFASVSSFYNLPRVLFRRLPLSISSPIEEIREQINTFKPDVISGYASGLNLLAEEQLAGHIDIAPTEAYCTGDPLTANFRQRIEKAFGTNPCNMYGSSETMTLAGECHAHHQLHLFDDWFSVQVVDDALLPARQGKAIITNLYNFTQPLIRYQMNDEIVLGEDRCPCGSPFPVIENIAGRHEEFLWFDRQDEGKDFIHPIVLAEFFVPGLEKFQFVQKSSNRLLMKAIPSSGNSDITPAIREKMHAILSKKSLQNSVRFNVETVEQIPNDPRSGKFKLIVPLSTT